MTLKTMGNLFDATILYQALCIILKSSVNANWNNEPETLKIAYFFSRLTLKNGRKDWTIHRAAWSQLKSYMWLTYDVMEIFVTNFKFCH